MTDAKPEHTLSFEDLTGGQIPSPEPPRPAAVIGAAQNLDTNAEVQEPIAVASTVPVSPPADQPTSPILASPHQVPVEPQPKVLSADHPTAHTQQNLPKEPQDMRRKLRPVAYALAGFTLFLIIFNFQLIAQQIGFFLHPTKPADNLVLQDPNATTASTAIVPPDNLVIIPKINVSAPVIYADTAADDVVMKNLQDGVVHYVNTANPGENGNVVIFGHSSNDWWEPGNYKFVFALLGKLEVGDQIQVNYSSRKYVYQVGEKKVVAPTEVSVLNPTPDPTLTLITCTPPGTSWQRLIVVAKQIQPAPNVKQSTGQVASAQRPDAQPVKSTTAKPKPLPGSAPTIGQQIGKIFSNIASYFKTKPSTTVPKNPTPADTQPRLPEVS